MILVIGYGNPLRRDDAVGQHVIHALEQRHIRGDVRLMSVYQLTPELVYAIRAASLVIFVDAHSEGEPGDIARETVQPEVGQGAFTHHFSPATLLGAVQSFYGTCPTAVLLSVTGYDFEYGESLSPYVRLAVPLVVLAIEDLVRQASHTESERNGIPCGTTA